MPRRQHFDELTWTKTRQVLEEGCHSYDTARPLMLAAAQQIEYFVGRGSSCEIALWDYATQQEHLIARSRQSSGYSSASPYYTFPLLHDRHGYLGVVRVYVSSTKRLADAAWAAIDRFVSELRRVATTVHLETLNRLDSLTRLPRMNEFRIHSEREFARSASREPRTPCALLLVDLDELWLLNETFKYATGSEAIQQVALTLKVAEKKFGRGAYIAHHWGEEFLVLVPGIHETRAREIGTEINQQIRQIRLQARGRNVPVRVSIGVAIFPQDSVTVDGLIDKAELALRLPKGQGKDCTRTFGDYAALSAKERRKVAHRVIARKAQVRGRHSSR